MPKIYRDASLVGEVNPSKVKHGVTFKAKPLHIYIHMKSDLVVLVSEKSSLSSTTTMKLPFLAFCLLLGAKVSMLVLSNGCNISQPDAPPQVCQGDAAAIGEAIRHLQLLGEDHCILLVGDGAPLRPPPTTVPVVVRTPRDLPGARSTCGGMVVVAGDPSSGGADQRRGEWLGELPWISNVVVITASTEWADRFPNVKRLQPTFFLREANSTGFEVHAWTSYLEHDLDKVAIFRQGAGYITKNQRDDEDGHHSGRLYVSDPKRLLDFGGREFPGVAFTFPPYSLPNYKNQEGHGGFEYEIAAAVTKGLNLRLVVRPPSKGGLWGVEDEHGNFNGEGQVAKIPFSILSRANIYFWTGIVGDLQQGVAEVGWANMFITAHRLRVIDFSDWYTVDPSCFLFKQPKPLSGILSLIYPFQKETWMFIFISVGGIFCYYLVYSRTKPQDLSFTMLLLYGTSVIFKESDRETHKFYTHSLR